MQLLDPVVLPTGSCPVIFTCVLVIFSKFQHYFLKFKLVKFILVTAKVFTSSGLELTPQGLLIKARGSN